MTESKFMSEPGTTRLIQQIKSMPDQLTIDYDETDGLHVIDGSITANKIADKAVTSNKIADFAELRGEMGLGNTLGVLDPQYGGTGRTSLDDLANSFSPFISTTISHPTSTVSDFNIVVTIPAGYSPSDFSSISIEMTWMESRAGWMLVLPFVPLDFVYSSVSDNDGRIPCFISNTYGYQNQPSLKVVDKGAKVTEQAANSITINVKGGYISFTSNVYYKALLWF